MNVGLQSLNRTLFAGAGGGMMKSTKEKMERQEKCASQVSFFEKQKENLKNMTCDSLEDIARKLEMFHSYEDQIAAAKKAYNNSQMSAVLDEARERGEKIAEAAEKAAPKTPEERREEMLEEAAGTEEESKGILTEIMEEMTEMIEEMTDEMAEEMLEEDLDEDMQELDEEVVGSIEKHAVEETVEVIGKHAVEETVEVIGKHAAKEIMKDSGTHNAGDTELETQTESIAEKAEEDLEDSSITNFENTQLNRQKYLKEQEMILNTSVFSDFDSGYQHYRHIDYRL